jgi:Ankyrin repeats (3 copies)
LTPGENCLHIAVVNQQLPLVRTLLRLSPSLLRGRATGKFFSPSQPCYYGECPLFFAACGNQPTLFDLLLEHGADITAVDSFGNTLLHLLVIHCLSDMYTYVCERAFASAEQRQALEAQPNGEGLTPLTLAAKLGNVDMFTLLLERRKTVQWTYGPVSCMLLPLDEFGWLLRVLCCACFSRTLYLNSLLNSFMLWRCWFPCLYVCDLCVCVCVCVLVCVTVHALLFARRFSVIFVPRTRHTN